MSFLALQYGIYAANYPLIDEDLNSIAIPSALKPFKHKLYGLTINPVRLQNIRDVRRSNSGYASIEQCRKEVRRAEDIFVQNDISFIDTSHISIEEIAGRILQKASSKEDTSLIVNPSQLGFTNIMKPLKRLQLQFCILGILSLHQ